MTEFILFEKIIGFKDKQEKDDTIRASPDSECFWKAYTTIGVFLLESWNYNCQEKCKYPDNPEINYSHFTAMKYDRGDNSIQIFDPFFYKVRAIVFYFLFLFILLCFLYFRWMETESQIFMGEMSSDLLEK